MLWLPVFASACCRSAIKAGGPTPACSLLSISTAPVNGTRQMSDERVILPSCLQMQKTRLKDGN